MDVLNVTPDDVPTEDTTLNIEGYDDHVEQIEQAYPEEDWRTPAEIEAEEQAQAEVPERLDNYKLNVPEDLEEAKHEMEQTNVWKFLKEPSITSTEYLPSPPS